MIICPNCNHVNPDGANNCESCFTPLPVMINCPQCDESVQEDAAFCGNCGYNLKQEQENSEVEAEAEPLSSISEPIANPEIEETISPENLDLDPPEETRVLLPTKIQMSNPVLVHVQTNQKLEIPMNLKVIHLGRPNDQIPPDLDMSSLPDSDVVSRIHADIRLEEDGYYYLEDMGSSNGTYVNGERLHQGDRHRLQTGDRFSLGKQNKVSFIFSLS